MMGGRFWIGETLKFDSAVKDSDKGHNTPDALNNTKGPCTLKKSINGTEPARETARRYTMGFASPVHM
jgi:hypothetical protein